MRSCITAPDAATRDHVLVRKRGRPTGSIRHNLSQFEDIENGLNPICVDDVDAVDNKGITQVHVVN